MGQKGLLSNVTIIRLVLIVLLVFYHAFVIFQGGWGMAGVFPEIEAYWWLDKLSYACLLETFVFISGYVFGYQVRTKGESKLDAKALFGSKFKRLIIPSMFFSFLYIVLLMDIKQPVVKTIWGIIEGVGHMWFLPMLFWCFAGVWIIEKLNLKPIIVVPLLILCSLFSFLPLPLQLNVTMYYLLFFYLGFIIQKRGFDLDRYYAPRYAIVFAFLFVLLFPVLTIYRENAESFLKLSGQFVYNPLVLDVIKHSSLNLAKLIYSTVGVALVFVLVGMLVKDKQLSSRIVSIGNLCMGVYLFQQFILLALYKHTALPIVVSPYVLPWIGFLVALIGSLAISFIFRLTKAGRFLIG